MGSYADEPELLYHYTTTEGLIGILQSGTSERLTAAFSTTRQRCHTDLALLSRRSRN